MKILQAICLIWIYNCEKYFYVLCEQDIVKIKMNLLKNSYLKI